MKSLLNNQIVLGAKFAEEGIANVNATMEDVIIAMCGEVLEVEEAYERAIALKEERRLRREEAKANRVKVKRAPVVKKGVKATPSNKEIKEAKRSVDVATRMEKFLGMKSLQLLASGSETTSENTTKERGVNMEKTAKYRNDLFIESTIGAKNIANEAKVLEIELTSVAGSEDSKVVKNVKGVRMVVGTTKFKPSRYFDKNGVINSRYTDISIINNYCIKIGNVLHKGGDNNKLVLSDEYVYLKFDKTIAQLVIDTEIFVNFKKGAIAIKDIEGSNDYINLETKRKVKINKDWVGYREFSESQGDLKQSKRGTYGSMFLKSSYVDKSGDRVEVDFNELRNNNSYGIIDGSIKKYGYDFEIKDAVTTSARITQGATQSVAKNKMKHLKLYPLPLSALEGEEDALDGIALQSASFVSKVFNVSKKRALQIATQIRPLSLKSQAVTVPDKLVKLVDEFMTLRAVELGMEVKSYGTNTKVTPEVIGDCDSSKFIPYDDSKPYYEHLKMMKDLKANSSRAMLEKVLVQAALTDYRNKLMKTPTRFYEDIVNTLIELGSDRVGEMFAEFEIKAFSSDSEISPDATGYAAQLAFEKGKVNLPGASTSQFKNLIESALNEVNKMSFLRDIADYQTLVSDYATMFGFRVLKEGEVFMGNSKELQSEYVMIKYPSMGIAEFYKCKSVTIDEVRNNIKTAGLPTIVEKLYGDKAEAKFEEIKEALIELYENMPSFHAMLPANAKIRKTNAGLDFDTDAAAFIKITNDKKGSLFNNLNGVNKFKYISLETTSEVAKRVAEEKKALKGKDASLKALEAKAKEGNEAAKALLATRRNPLNRDFLPQMLKERIVKDSASVGKISDDNSRLIALLTAFISDKVYNDGATTNVIECIKNVLKENFGQSTGTIDKYVPLPIVDEEVRASIDLVDSMIEQIKNVKMTVNNVIAILLDMNHIFRLYQEGTIDSAKTGIVVEILFQLQTIILRSNEEYNLSMETSDNIDKGACPFIIERKERNLNCFVKDITKKARLNDAFSVIQDAIVKEIKASINRALSHGVLNTGRMIDGKIVDESSKLLGLVSKFASDDKLSVMFEDLYRFRQVYTSLAIELMEARQAIEEETDNEDVIEEARRAMSNQFNERCACISNSVRKMLGKIKNMSSVHKGMLMVAIGALDRHNFTINSSRANTFAFNIAPEYALGFALQGTEVECTSEIIHIDKCYLEMEEGVTEETEIVKVVNGATTDYSLVLKDKFFVCEDREATIELRKTLVDGKVKVKAVWVKELEDITVEENMSTLMLSSDMETSEIDDEKVVVKPLGVPAEISNALLEGKDVTITAISKNKVAIKGLNEDESLVVVENKNDGSENNIIFNDLRKGVEYGVSYLNVIRQKDRACTTLELVTL